MKIVSVIAIVKKNYIHQQMISIEVVCVYVKTANAKKRRYYCLIYKGFRMNRMICRVDYKGQRMPFITESVVDLICWVSQQEQESI